MKRVVILALLVVFGAVVGALAHTETWTNISTYGYTTLTETITTDFTKIFESVEFVPGPGAPSFELNKYTSVFDGIGYNAPGPGPTPPWLSDTYGTYLYEEKHVDATGGTTTFAECAVGGGFTGAAGYIGEVITNTDRISIDKYVWNFGEWHLAEYKYVSGSGATYIHKQVATWGLLNASGPHPTDALAYVYFSGVSGEEEEQYYTAGGVLLSNLPDYDTALDRCEGDWGRDNADFFEFRVGTDEPFEYSEDAGINPFWPYIEP